MPSHFVPIPHRALTQPSRLPPLALAAQAREQSRETIIYGRLFCSRAVLLQDRTWFGTAACETKTGCQPTGFIQVRVRRSCRDQRMPWSRMCPARALFPGTLSPSAILHSTVQPTSQSSPALSRFQGHILDQEPRPPVHQASVASGGGGTTLTIFVLQHVWHSSRILPADYHGGPSLPALGRLPLTRHSSVQGVRVRRDILHALRRSHGGWHRPAWL